MLIQRYQFQIFADYFQLYLEDENPVDTPEHLWDDQKSVELGLAIGKGSIAIGTARNSIVPFSLEIHDVEPDDDYSAWDRVNECSIEIPSGVLVIFGCTEYRPDAARIKVSPQCYRARIYYGALDEVTEFNNGNDHYKVTLWIAPFSEMKILKDRMKKF